MVKLGDKIADRISGIEGICTGRAEYLYGCKQVLLAPRGMTKDGEPRDAKWYDEDRVSVIENDAEARPASADERAGGPQSNPAPVR